MKRIAIMKAQPLMIVKFFLGHSGEFNLIQLLNQSAIFVGVVVSVLNVFSYTLPAPPPSRLNIIFDLEAVLLSNSFFKLLRYSFVFKYFLNGITESNTGLLPEVLFRKQNIFL